MGKVLYDKNGILIKCEFGDVALYTNDIMVFKPDTPENRKVIFDIAGVKEI